MRIAVAGGTGIVGRHVVGAVQARGHDAVVLSRARGVDLTSGEGLGAALDGVDVIVDVSGPTADERAALLAFFGEVPARLGAVGAVYGVRHLVTLSIVGIDRAPGYGYYAAKLRQEQVAQAGPLPSTILRAAQFHEFAVQMLHWTTQAGVAHVPHMRVQPVAARTVGKHLIALAEAAPAGRVPDLAGPEVADLAELARAFVQHFGLPLAVEAAPPDPAVPDGANLPTAGARLDGPTFAQWLESEDAACLARPA